MPCDTQIPREMTPEQRAAQIDKAVRALEQELMTGGVQVILGPDGAIAFGGWADQNRKGVSDVCAYNKLVQQGSSALQMAIQQAEALSGVSFNQQAVATGRHSHDGGHTWHNGH